MRRGLEAALREYVDAPTDDCARELAGLVSLEGSVPFLASVCRSLMRAPLVGPHDIALAAAAAYAREKSAAILAPLAKCEPLSPAREEREGGRDGEADRQVQGRVG